MTLKEELSYRLFKEVLPIKVCVKLLWLSSFVFIKHNKRPYQYKGEKQHR